MFYTQALILHSRCYLQDFPGYIWQHMLYTTTPASSTTDEHPVQLFPLTSNHQQKIFQQFLKISKVKENNIWKKEQLKLLS